MRQPRLLSVLSLAWLFLLAGGCSPEARKERHLQRANRYFETGQYLKAKIEYFNVLRLDRNHPLAMQRLGLSCFEQGEIGFAFRFLLRSEELQPENLEIRSKLGQIYLSAGQLPQARKEAVFILERRPDDEAAMLLLSDTSVKPEEIEDTRQRLEALRARAEGKAAFHLALGNLHMRQRNRPSAEAEFNKALALEPKSSVVHTALGHFHWRHGEKDPAERAFRTAAELSPITSTRRLAYIEFKAQTGAMEEAKRLLKEMTEQAPDYLPPWVYLGKFAFAESKLEDCLQVVQTILARDPANFDALLLRARVKVAQGQTAQAFEELLKLSKQYPYVPQVHFELGKAHLRNNDVPQAITSLKQASLLDSDLVDAVLLLAELNLRKGDADSSIRLMDDLIRKRPNLEPAYFLLANAYRQRGRLEEAVRVYRVFSAIYPQNPQAQFLLGLVLREQNRKAEARQAYQKAVELEPNFLPALDQLVELDILDKDFATAARRAKAHAEKHPNEALPQLVVAKVQWAQRDLNQTEATLLRAIELDAGLRQAYMLLADVYAAANKFEEALRRLENLLSKNPKDIAALTQVGMIYEKIGKIPQAAEAYEKLLAVQPNFGLAINNLAYLYVERLGKVNQAYDLAIRARKLFPRDPFAADTFGWILFKRGDYPWALSLLQESAERMPTEPEVQAHLGMAFYMMGQEQSARAALRRALQLRNEFPGSDEAKRLLGLLDLSIQSADEQVTRALEARLTEQPGDPVALVRLAAIYERDGAVEKAKRAYENALKANPKAVPVIVKLAELRSTRLQDPKGGLELAKQARNLAPEDPFIAHMVGRLAYQLQDYRWSLSLLEESAAKLPREPAVLLDLAQAQYALGRLAEAEKSLKTALQAGPGFAGAEAAGRLLRMIEIYKQPGKAQEAADEVQTLLKTDPDYAPALMLLAILHEEKNPDAAKKTYERILLRLPLFTPAMRRLSILLSEQGTDDKKAFDLGIKAREAFPEDPELAKALGIVLFRRGDFSWSARLLRESVRKQPEDPDSNFFLGMAHYRLKQREESLAALRRALTLKVKQESATQAQQIIAELDKKP